jgi:hypothetical protein
VEELTGRSRIGAPEVMAIAGYISDPAGWMDYWPVKERLSAI